MHKPEELLNKTITGVELTKDDKQLTLTFSDGTLLAIRPAKLSDTGMYLSMKLVKASFL